MVCNRFCFSIQNIYFAISPFLKIAKGRRRCQRHLHVALNGLQPFSFFGPKHFFRISQFLMAAQARRRCLRHLQTTLNGLRPFSFFGPKMFFAISPFLKVTQARRRCYGHMQSAMNGLRPFSFFGTKFFFDISFSEGRIGETEVSAAHTSCVKRFATIFVFRSKKLFAISPFLKVVQAGRRCQRHLQVARAVCDHFRF